MTRAFSTSRMIGRWGISLAAGASTVLVLRAWRGFFWSHAVLVGLAVAALAYSVWRTWDQMRGGSD